jgi:hypothetical protein
MSSTNSSLSLISTISIDSIKLENKPKYVHVVKHSSADTLITTIPRSHVKALQISKGDILAMTLDGKRVIMEKV